MKSAQAQTLQNCFCTCQGGKKTFGQTPEVKLTPNHLSSVFCHLSSDRGRGAFCKPLKVKPGGRLEVSEVRMLT